MPCNFSKQPQFLTRKYLNSGNGEAVLQGQLTGVPVGVTASQGIQDLPGDRIIFGAADALALSDPTVGTLYEGLYQYVGTQALSTLPFEIGHAVYWNGFVADSAYEVSADEQADDVGSFAGVLINTITRGYWGWIQIAGKVSAVFQAQLTGTPVAGCPVYLSDNDLGEFDVYAGTAPNADTCFERFVGWTVDLASGNNSSIINLPIWRVRW